MQEIGNAFVNAGVQCWTCPVFDTLFAIISNTAAAAYQRLTLISIIIFCVLFGFYILNAVWQNIKGDGSDPFLLKSAKPVIIKSLLALSLLSAGLMVPHLISTVTFEPAATLTLEFSKTMSQGVNVAEGIYQKINLDNNGFFNPELRDTLLTLIETSVTNFQVFIKTGIGIMDSAFSIRALLGFGALIRHIIIFYIGLFLTYNFAKLFIKYSFCFMDIIVAMAMFAFFFPLSVVFFIFKDAANLPGWMKKLGGDLGSGQIKKIVNAIVSVASAILTYTIIMVIIRGFLDTNGVNPDAISNSAESLFNFDLDNSNAMEITFAGAIVLVYVINDIADQIPKITQKILEVFGITQEDKLSKEMGENAWQLTNIAFNNVKNITKAIINPESVKKEKDEKATKPEKTDTKKEDKK